MRYHPISYCPTSYRPTSYRPMSYRPSRVLTNPRICLGWEVGDAKAPKTKLKKDDDSFQNLTWEATFCFEC